MQVDTLANDIKHLNKSDHEVKYGEPVDPKISSYGTVHK
jgi:hypothetical protein